MTARKYALICSYPGCGRKHNARGLCNPHGAMQRRGEPLRPIQNRTGPIARPALERFADKIALASSGCIEWIGGLTLGGYGMFTAERAMAHRWSWEYHVGPIPTDFDIDHLCRNRRCVNPEHLEPVTRQENIRRAFADLTHCPSGHEYTETNTYVRPGTTHRKCRTCMRDRDLKRADAKNAKRREQRRLIRVAKEAA